MERKNKRKLERKNMEEKKTSKRIDKKRSKEEKKEEKVKEEKIREMKKLKEEKEKREKDAGKIKMNVKMILLIGIISGLIMGGVFFIFDRDYINSIIVFVVIIIFSFLYGYFRGKLKEAERIKKIENVFPDFLQLVSSNLRAGITIDKAILLSSRPEFAPLDKEILSVGKDIATGKDVETALLDMTKRIKSEKIHKTILLIISGLRAGGNLAVLLEETSTYIRERGFVEKRAASNVLMYVIFIFVAVGVGAPALFSLSSILVETLTNLLAGLPSIDASQANMPFTLSSIEISITFIKYFSIAFIIVINVLASLVLGLVSKGEEREGIKYMLPLLIISMVIFFGVRIILSGVLGSLFE